MSSIFSPRYNYDERFFERSEMTEVERRHLVKLCRDNMIDTREIDPSLSYYENKHYLEQFIKIVEPEPPERKSIYRIVIEFLQKQETVKEDISDVEVFSKLISELFEDEQLADLQDILNVDQLSLFLKTFETVSRYCREFKRMKKTRS